MGDGRCRMGWDGMTKNVKGKDDGRKGDGDDEDDGR